MSVTIPPRAHYLTAPLHPEQQRPLPFDSGILDHLPPEITALTGAIQEVSRPQQGLCNLLLLLTTERGRFVLKVAWGGYRGQELWAEHTIMQELHGGPVPVPGSLAFAQLGELSFQLRAYADGQPLKEVLAADDSLRPAAIRAMGQTLAAIHARRPAAPWTWEQWLDASLAQAARHLAAGVGDPEEFTPEAPPAVVLDWLRANRPAGGSVCLLHGDYRPKNLLWQAGRISSVIDWAFVDVGDPYYDLSIFRWYMRDEEEWQQFLAAYGLGAFDQERFDYCMALHKFLSV